LIPAKGGRVITGRGSFDVTAPPAQVWHSLLDPDSLRAVIPGCHALETEGANAYHADVSLGVGPVQGRFTAHVRLSDLEVERAARLSGTLAGPLGSAAGGGLVRLSATAAGTRLDYDYAVTVSGKVAAVGGRLIDGAAEIVIRKFFERLARHVGAPKGEAKGKSLFAALWRRVLSRFKGKR
jgi:2-furoyl-CoA dehydrogenase large subunit